MPDEDEVDDILRKQVWMMNDKAQEQDQDSFVEQAF
jgi:hypothetical protein